MYFSHGGISIRKVSGQTRLFRYGNVTDASPLMEFSIPDTAHPTLASAPVAPLTKHWGKVQEGRTITGGSNWWPGGMHWDQSRNALWWSYGDIYAPVQHHPTIGCTVLNDTTGTWQSFGPWRTEWNAQRTRGNFCSIPDAFASSHTRGKRVGLMSSQASGNGTSPFGAILSGVSFPDPSTTPADTATNTHWTIENHGLILHDAQHRQARDTRYKTCGWVAGGYDCRQGSQLAAGVGLFGGSDLGSGENDTMSACVWIDLPDKHGLLYFGQLVTTPDGYRAPGDPDGLVHMWYGNPWRSDGWPEKTCCHYQDDPFWQGTGPGAHYRVPMGWIYDPTQLVDTAAGRADLWSRTPSSTFQWPTLFSAINARYPAGAWQGAAFDPDTRRIYAVIGRHDDITVPPYHRPVILVFDVR